MCIRDRIIRVECVAAISSTSLRNRWCSINRSESGSVLTLVDADDQLILIIASIITLIKNLLSDTIGSVLTLVDVDSQKYCQMLNLYQH